MLLIAQLPLQEERERERELPLGGSQLPKRAARCAAPDAELLRDP